MYLQEREMPKSLGYGICELRVGVRTGSRRERENALCQPFASWMYPNGQQSCYQQVIALD
jgi:hypothetical protein